MRNSAALEQARRDACVALAKINIESMRLPITDAGCRPEEIVEHVGKLIIDTGEFFGKLRLLLEAAKAEVEKRKGVN